MSAATICLVPEKPKSSPTTSAEAEALRRRMADWAAGAQEGRELDRRVARRQTQQERLDSGLKLVRVADELQRPD